MKVKEIYVESAPSKNFQKHTVGMQVEITYDTEEELFTQVRKAQTMCRKLAQEQIKLDEMR